MSAFAPGQTLAAAHEEIMDKLIINADDFGLTEGINNAVVEGYRRGVISSTTLMATAPAAGHAARLAAENPGLGVGLHLNLTWGEPALPAGRVRSLVTGDGRFPGPAAAVARLSTGWARAAELAAELEAQAGRLRALGLSATHIESNHHLHAHPRLRHVIARVCPRLGITRMRGYRMQQVDGPKALAVRLAAALPAGSGSAAQMATPDRFFGIGTMGGKDFTPPLARALGGGKGTLEFMCHPGYADRELQEVSRYGAPRGSELKVLLDPAFRKMLDASGARLVSFAGL